MHAILRGVPQQDRCLCVSRRTFLVEVSSSDLSDQRLEDDHYGCQGCIPDICIDKVSLDKALVERLGL